MAADLRDMSSIDAKDKLPFWVTRQRQLALTTFLRVDFFKEHALFFLFLQSLTNCQSAMSQGRVGRVANVVEIAEQRAPGM